jgi:GntR family transcriptional repressor for pyruvate dehydrogenase complex
MERRYREVADELMLDVVTGRLPRSGRLPGAAELERRFGVSRGVIREAIRALEERRLVEAVAGRGPVVLPDDRWDLLSVDVLDAMFGSRLDPALLGETLEAFRLVEIQAGALAVRRARHGDLGLLEGCLRRMERAVGSARRLPGAEDPFVDAQVSLHQAILHVAGNRLLVVMGAPLNVVLATLRHERAPEREPAVLRDHQRIVAALRARDAPATTGALDEHVEHLSAWLTD